MSTPITTPQPGTRDVIERVARQLLQVAGPAIVAVLTSPNVGDAQTTVVALASVLIVTALKALAGLKAGPGAPLWLVVADRAGSAFGSLLIGLGVVDWAGLISLDWGKALTAAVSAAVVAAIAYFTTPPTVAPTPVEPASTDYDATDTTGGTDL